MTGRILAFPLTLATVTSIGCSAGPGGPGTHMTELSADLTKIYLSSNRRAELTVVDATTLTPDASPEALAQRAYVACRDSDDLMVIDLRTLEMVSSGTSYRVLKRIPVGKEDTHMSKTRDGKTIALMDEDDDAVSFIDTASDVERKRLPGFFLPHFMRMSLDGKYGYVANLKADHLTRVDLASLTIDGEVALDGAAATSGALDDEDGFADAQIDQQTGVLYAANRHSGQVVVYDSAAQQTLSQVAVGKRPWIVYAEHPFSATVKRAMVPNFVDETATVLAGTQALSVLPYADAETYGVNYSPLVPNQAFLMNRQKKQIAVVDLAQQTLIDTIDVGGTTETASTSADGKYIVATVSSINRVVVIDAVTHAVVKQFDNVGKYPWTVTIPNGDNYCH